MAALSEEIMIDKNKRPAAVIYQSDQAMKRQPYDRDASRRLLLICMLVSLVGWLAFSIG